MECDLADEDDVHLRLGAVLRDDDEVWGLLVSVGTNTSPQCVCCHGQPVLHGLVCVAGGGLPSDASGLPSRGVFEDLYRLNTTTSMPVLQSSDYWMAIDIVLPVD